MIGTTCGIIFLVLSVLAVFHTRKLRRQREQSRRSEVASTASFDVHQANAPPSYETGITSIFRGYLVYLLESLSRDARKLIATILFSLAPTIRLYSWLERGAVRVKCLAQEHDTMV